MGYPLKAPDHWEEFAMEDVVPTQTLLFDVGSTHKRSIVTNLR